LTIRNAVPAIALLALIAGLWARVHDLERKVFWPDEAFTALRVSGHSLSELRGLFDDRVHPLAALAAYQEPAPGSSVSGVVASFAAEEPQHPPLFYVLDRFAVDALGSSIAAYRSMSVVAGVVAIGCAFALGVAAFGSRTGGLVLGSLVAVSPYHLQLSRQAREYELFSTMALGSSALLLWALARPAPQRWAAYAASVALGLYTDPLFAGVIAAQAVTVVATQRTRAALAGFVAACAVAALAFAPWAVVLVHERHAAGSQLSWLAGTYPLEFLVQKWVFNLGTAGFDAELRDLRLVAVVAAFLALVAVALVHAVRLAFRAKPDAPAVLALALTLIPWLVFGAYDLVERAHYTTVARYFAGSIVGIEMLIAAWVVAALGTPRRLSAFGFAAFVLIVAGGIASAVASAGAATWWDNNMAIDYASVAARVDADPVPLLVVGDAAAALVLSHYAAPGTRFLLVSDPQRSARSLAARDGPAYLIAPSPALKSALSAQGFTLADISPRATTPLAGFRTALERERPDTALGQDSRENALWTVRRDAGR
jgi:uncharacterized membrane protein